MFQLSKKHPLLNIPSGVLTSLRFLMHLCSNLEYSATWICYLYIQILLVVFSIKSDSFFSIFIEHCQYQRIVFIIYPMMMFLSFTVCICSFPNYLLSFLEDDNYNLFFFRHKEMSSTLSLILISLYPYLYSELLKG